ncbi:MAG: LPS assembly protein LptD [Candidatus Magnetoovum sp. WYHC-5]|nr:LPS assembly protein LptD [Candidatus Magnetoovum sp. WYHC-5]
MLRVLYFLLMILFVITSFFVNKAYSFKNDAKLGTGADAIIKADRLEYDLESTTYYLTGNVSIERTGSILKADFIQYDEGTYLAHAVGNVIYEDAEVTIKAQSATMYMDSKTGNISKAKILFKKENYHVQSEIIIKQSDKEFYAEDASITTCDSLVPAWCLNAKKANLFLEEKMKAKDVTFRVRGLPVMYSPSFSSSLAGRKTGFLTPGFGFKGDKGVYTSIPFYWVIAKNRDMTLTADSYTRRGLGQGIEYRYVEQGGIQGNWWAYHFYDKDLETDFIEIKGKHKQITQEGFAASADVNYLNEKEFYKEYSPNIEEYMERYLESEANLYYKTAKTRTYLLGQYWVDLRGDTGAISEKVPEVGFVLNPINAWFIDNFSLRSSYANFISEHGYKGGRFDLFPRIQHTIGNTVRLTQRVGERLTVYQLSGSGWEGSNDINAAFEYYTSADMTFSKNYGSFTHVVEPQVSYSYVSEDNSAPVIDETEEFDRQSLLELAIMNYFRNEKGDFLYLRLANPYDIGAPDGPNRQFKFQAGLLRPIALKAEALYDYEDNEIESANSELSLTFNKIYANLGERYNQKKDLLFLTGGLGFDIFRDISLYSSIWYDTKEDDIRNLGLDLNYKRQCWGVSLLYRKNVDDYGLYFTIELKGLGEYKISGI